MTIATAVGSARAGRLSVTSAADRAHTGWHPVCISGTESSGTGDRV
jgi:hypothetical protein